jgi:hypothetical protein
MFFTELIGIDWKLPKLTAVSLIILKKNGPTKPDKIQRTLIPKDLRGPPLPPGPGGGQHVDCQHGPHPYANADRTPAPRSMVEFVAQRAL